MQRWRDRPPELEVDRGVGAGGRSGVDQRRMWIPPLDGIGEESGVRQHEVGLSTGQLQDLPADVAARRLGQRDDETAFLVAQRQGLQPERRLAGDPAEGGRLRGRVLIEIDDAHPRLLCERHGQVVLVDGAEADQEPAERCAPGAQLLLGERQRQIVGVDERASHEQLADAQRRRRACGSRHRLRLDALTLVRHDHSRSPRCRRRLPRGIPRRSRRRVDRHLLAPLEGNPGAPVGTGCSCGPDEAPGFASGGAGRRSSSGSGKDRQLGPDRRRCRTWASRYVPR